MQKQNDEIKCPVKDVEKEYQYINKVWNLKMIFKSKNSWVAIFYFANMSDREINEHIKALDWTVENLCQNDKERKTLEQIKKKFNLIVDKLKHLKEEMKREELANEQVPWIKGNFVDFLLWKKNKGVEIFVSSALEKKFGFRLQSLPSSMRFSQTQTPLLNYSYPYDLSIGSVGNSYSLVDLLDVETLKTHVKNLARKWRDLGEDFENRLAKKLDELYEKLSAYSGKGAYSSVYLIVFQNWIQTIEAWRSKIRRKEKEMEWEQIFDALSLFTLWRLYRYNTMVPKENSKTKKEMGKAWEDVITIYPKVATGEISPESGVLLVAHVLENLRHLPSEKNRKRFGSEPPAPKDFFSPSSFLVELKSSNISKDLQDFSSQLCKSLEDLSREIEKSDKLTPKERESLKKTIEGMVKHLKRLSEEKWRILISRLLKLFGETNKFTGK